MKKFYYTKNNKKVYIKDGRRHFIGDNLGLVNHLFKHGVESMKVKSVSFTSRTSISVSGFEDEVGRILSLESMTVERK